MTEHPDPNLERRSQSACATISRLGYRRSTRPMPPASPGPQGGFHVEPGGARRGHRPGRGRPHLRCAAAARTHRPKHRIGDPGADASPTAAPTLSATAGIDLGAIIRVAPGENVQVGPASEDLLHAFDQAWTFAQSHADDLGYPWVDPGPRASWCSRQ